MRKWLKRCALAAALIVIVLLLVVSQTHPPGIWTGKPLPPGKVRPQLVNAWFNVVLLAPDGSLWAWGDAGASGSPLPATSEIPLRIGSDSDWVQVAFDMANMLALKSDGSLWSWRWKANANHPYGVPTRIGKETNWTQISTSFGDILGLKNDGSLWTWDYNSEGKFADETANSNSIPTMVGTDRDWRAIATGSMNPIALKRNGTMWGWEVLGVANKLAPKQMDPGTNWLSISAYDETVMALKTDGSLWIKSPGAYMMVSPFDPSSSGHFMQIGRDRDWTEAYAGNSSFFARKKDGSWWFCGQNPQGLLGLGTNIGGLVSPQRIPFRFDPWAFAAGDVHTVLLSKDGKLWNWGKRLGTAHYSAARRKIQNFLIPIVRRFPSLHFLLKSDVDYTPHLLWELPPEVRRSLGSGPNPSTNN